MLKNEEKIKDPRRNNSLTDLILKYNSNLIKKIELGYKYYDFSEGNFSLSPFYINYEKILPINQNLIEDLLNYLEDFSQINEKIFNSYSLIQIQINLALSVIDEEYCIISLLSHLIATFKISTNFLSFNVYEKELKAKIFDLELKFEIAFRNVSKFFEKLKIMKEFKERIGFIPKLSEEVIDYIKNIKILQKENKEKFNIFDYLNNHVSIFFLKIPLSYGTTINKNQINDIIG